MKKERRLRRSAARPTAGFSIAASIGSVERGGSLFAAEGGASPPSTRRSECARPASAAQALHPSPPADGHEPRRPLARLMLHTPREAVRHLAQNPLYRIAGMGEEESVGETVQGGSNVRELVRKTQE